jgi:hypothetical protein
LDGTYRDGNDSKGELIEFRKDEEVLMVQLRALEGWDPNLGHLTETFHPTCLSTRSPTAAFNLTPTSSSGWFVTVRVYR